jgi:hypothetical protein
MSRLLQWFFRNRETGAITIGQMPNTPLWIFIVGTALLWAWRPAGRIGVNLECLVKASLVVWAIDELVRGVNPWRRCLGAAVLVYEVFTFVG